jgi:hypothetical protein
MRPHYLPEELDSQCEAIIIEYLKKKYGAVAFPISTDDLTCLLERDAQSLDLYADLSNEEGQVEGVTEFLRGQKPVVKIAAELTENSNLENRLRTTLTHEYGHVRFHDFLFQTEEQSSLSLFEEPGGNPSQTNRCNRDSMLPLSDVDWMEWQAGFVCGALLIPIGPLIERVRNFRQTHDLDHAALSDRSPEGAALIGEIVKKFQTSRDAARVRLLQKRILTLGDMKSLL